MTLNLNSRKLLRKTLRGLRNKSPINLTLIPETFFRTHLQSITISKRKQFTIFRNHFRYFFKHLTAIEIDFTLRRSHFRTFFDIIERTNAILALQNPKFAFVNLIKRASQHVSDRDHAEHQSRTNRLIFDQIDHLRRKCFVLSFAAFKNVTTK